MVLTPLPDQRCALRSRPLTVKSLPSDHCKCAAEVAKCRVLKGQLLLALLLQCQQSQPPTANRVGLLETPPLGWTRLRRVAYESGRVSQKHPAEEPVAVVEPQPRQTPPRPLIEYLLPRPTSRAWPMVPPRLRLR